MRISQPGTGRISLVLVLEHTVKDEDFFASDMTMSTERGARCPANQRCVAIPCTVERTDVKSRCHARVPDAFFWKGDDSLGVGRFKVTELDE